MGRPKPWISLAGVPLLRVVTNAVVAVCDRAWVVAARDQSLPALPNGVERCDDPSDRAGGGPLGALLTGLEAAGAMRLERVYCGAGDAIHITADHVRFMLDALHGGEFEAAVPVTFDPRADKLAIHGLAGAVRTGPALAAARSLWHAGERSVQALYRQLETHQIGADELPDARVLRPCNTPAELAAALAREGRKTPA